MRQLVVECSVHGPQHVVHALPTHTTPAREFLHGDSTDAAECPQLGVDQLRLIDETAWSYG